MIDLETNEELTMQDNFGNEFINFKYLCIFFVIPSIQFMFLSFNRK